MRCRLQQLLRQVTAEHEAARVADDVIDLLREAGVTRDPAALRHALHLGEAGMAMTPAEVQLVHSAQAMGYGRAMQLIATAWGLTDPVGALTVGPCRRTLEVELARLEGGR